MNERPVDPARPRESLAVAETQRTSEADPTFENYPLTRAEYINAMVHFYRGEMHRAQLWRTRLDTTTNWAVFTVAGMTSFTFSDPSHSPFILVLGSLLVTAFLCFEAR